MKGRGWPAAARVLAGTTGGALTAYGAKRRYAVGAALGTLGFGLLAGGLSRMRGTTTQLIEDAETRVTETGFESSPSREDDPLLAAPYQIP
jgi:hypothetical protein